MTLPIPSVALEDCGAILGRRGAGKSAAKPQDRVASYNEVRPVAVEISVDGRVTFSLREQDYKRLIDANAQVSDLLGQLKVMERRAIQAERRANLYQSRLSSVRVAVGQGEELIEAQIASIIEIPAQGGGGPTIEDARTRVHVWPHRDGSACWSVGPTGTRFHALSPGSALDVFIETHRPKGAVVILERESE